MLPHSPAQASMPSNNETLYVECNNSMEKWMDSVDGAISLG